MISLKKFLDELPGENRSLTQGPYGMSEDIRSRDKETGEKGGDGNPPEKQLPIRFLRSNNN